MSVQLALAVNIVMPVRIVNTANTAHRMVVHAEFVID